MFLNGIKHNVVTKLNPLSLNVGSDEQTNGTDENYIPLRHTSYARGIIREK